MYVFVTCVDKIPHVGWCIHKFLGHGHDNSIVGACVVDFVEVSMFIPRHDNSIVGACVVDSVEVNMFICATMAYLSSLQS